MIALLVGLALVAAAPADRPAAPFDPTPAEQVLVEMAQAMLDEDDAFAPLTEEALGAYPDARGMPADVQAFIVRWQDCNHWLGEEPFDADRARQIEEAVADTCLGTDALGRDVRARHADNAEVLARIADYEEFGE